MSSFLIFFSPTFKSEFSKANEFDQHFFKKSDYYDRRSQEAKNLSNWVDGPVSLWYKNQNFGLSGFSISQSDYVKPETDPKFKFRIESDWKHKIIFDSETELEKVNLSPIELNRRLKLAGWIVSPTCKSYAEFCAQSNIIKL